MLTLSCMAIGYVAFSQQLFFEVYSGYHLTDYDYQPYEESMGYFPIGFKLAGGHEHVQLGVDYRQHLNNPAFEILNGSSKIDFDETYYGAFIRGNISSLPAYRFGLILSAGMGYYIPTANTYLAESSEPISSFEYEKNLGYNFYIGVSAPIFAQLHWEIGYQYNMVNRENGPAGIPNYAGNYHCIHVGLSGNFVFGNTQKRCRRVITTRRR